MTDDLHQVLLKSRVDKRTLHSAKLYVYLDKHG